jgi:hypothetical protein
MIVKAISPTVSGSEVFGASIGQRATLSTSPRAAPRITRATTSAMLTVRLLVFGQAPQISNFSLRCQTLRPVSVRGPSTLMESLPTRTRLEHPTLDGSCKPIKFHLMKYAPRSLPELAGVKRRSLFADNWSFAKLPRNSSICESVCESLLGYAAS